MKWLKEISYQLTKLFKLQFRYRMAKIILEDYGNKAFEFDLSDLIYIGYDENSDSIVVVLSNQKPKYLPVTDGNLNFLKKLSPYFRAKANNDPRIAEEKLHKNNIQTPKFDI